MNFSISALAAGFIYGALGVYLIKRGRADAEIPSILIGVTLLIYPYFIENEILLWGVGAALLWLDARLRR